LFAVCLADVEDEWLSTPAWCRPVACQSRADCPQVFEYERVYSYECRHGLCQNADKETWPPDFLKRKDAWLLCYAGYPRAETLNSLDAHIEVGGRVTDACTADVTRTTSCTLPLPFGCRQP